MDQWLEQKIKDLKCFFGYHYHPFLDGRDAMKVYEKIILPWRCQNCKRTIMYQFFDGSRGWMVSPSKVHQFIWNKFGWYLCEELRK